MGRSSVVGRVIWRMVPGPFGRSRVVRGPESRSDSGVTIGTERGEEVVEGSEEVGSSGQGEGSRGGGSVESAHASAGLVGDKAASSQVPRVETALEVGVQPAA